MLLQKQGLPTEGELVLCTVTKIHPHGVFANLEEYANKSGMIHISEIAPGRIRNIREFVKEGKVVVCSILRINVERGYIDLSLRRVNENQRRKKVNAIKQEQKAEKIVENLAKELKRDLREVYQEVTEKVFEKYTSLYGCFEEIAKEQETLKNVGFIKSYAPQLEALIKLRIKPPIVYIKGKLSIVSYEPKGVETVKKALTAAKETGKNALDIKYLGAGKYGFTVNAEEYKAAEQILKEAVDAAIKVGEKANATVEFEREAKKVKQ